MSTMLTAGLIVCGLLTAGCVWVLNLKLDGYGPAARWGSMLGIALLLVMFIYSIHYVKGADYSRGLILALSVGMTIVWLLACGFTIGVLVIVSVGAYWLVTTWRKTDFREFWSGVKSDFKTEVASLKSWIDDEE